MFKFAQAAILGGILCAVGVVAPISAQTVRATSSQVLVPAVYQQRNDAHNFGWYHQQDGTVQVGNGSFSEGGRLLVGNSLFAPHTREMTADGSEFFFAGLCNNVEVRRRVKVDLATSTVRFVDTLTNRTNSDIKDIEVALTTMLRNPGVQLVNDLGDPVATNNVKSSGAVAVNAVQPQLPWIAFFTGSPRAKVRPTRFSGSSARTVQPAYQVTIPRGGSITLVTGIHLHLQPGANPQGATVFGGAPPRQSQPDPKELAAAMEPFRARDWLADLPRDVRSQVANHVSTGGDELPNGQPLRPLHELLDRINVSTEEVDVLLLEDDSKIKGGAHSVSLKMTTAYGTAEPLLQEVAAVVGANGRGGPMMLYLRNGEVLVGQLETDQFFVTTDAGLKIDLVPELMNVLILRGQPVIDAPPPVAFMTTASGDRFGVQVRPADTLHAATPWGALTVPLEAVDSFIHRSRPQPGVQLQLRDRSRLTVYLVGPQLELQTSRWGKLALPSHVMRRWDRTVFRPAGAEEPYDDGALAIGGPHVRIADDVVLVGTPTETSWQLGTDGGVRSVETRLITRLERTFDNQFECELVDGSVVAGSLNASVVSVANEHFRFRIPISQLMSLRGAPAEPRAENPFAPRTSSAVTVPASALKGRIAPQPVAVPPPAKLLFAPEGVRSGASTPPVAAPIAPRAPASSTLDPPRSRP